MINLLHTCKYDHQWAVRCDFSDDGLLYPDPMETVCPTCFEMGGAMHDLTTAYRICPGCMTHYGVLLTRTEKNTLTLPERFPMLCEECGRNSTEYDYYDRNGVISLPVWAYLRRKPAPQFIDAATAELDEGQ